MDPLKPAWEQIKRDARAAREGPHWQITLDMLITRRKLFHVLSDPSGTVVLVSRNVSELFHYLAEHQITEYSLQLAPDREGREPRLILTNKETLSWQNSSAP